MLEPLSELDDQRSLPGFHPSERASFLVTYFAGSFLLFVLFRVLSISTSSCSSIFGESRALRAGTALSQASACACVCRRSVAVRIMSDFVIIRSNKVVSPFSQLYSVFYFADCAKLQWLPNVRSALSRSNTGCPIREVTPIS